MAAPTDNQLSAPVVTVGLCAFLDIKDDPLRYALAPFGPLVTIGQLTGAPDGDFDGQTFETLDPRFISVSPVAHEEGGVGSVEFTLSGTLELDSDILNGLADPAKFRGRVARMWLVLIDPASSALIAARSYYRGYMTQVAVTSTPPDADGHAMQTVKVTTENYLALLGGAPARTLMWTPDPDDHAPAATIGSWGASAALGNGMLTLPNGQQIPYPVLPPGLF